MRAPLSGVCIADFSELLPGPFLTQALRELGAKVIKIERPPGGDAARQSSPGLFGSVNRGKESLLIDLKTDAGRQEALEIAASADVVVEGYRPGVMGRLGLGYEAVSARNPRVIYLSLTGYGQSGPLRDLPGHDLNYLASAGVTSLCGSPGEPPRHGIGLPIADLGGAVYGLSALLAALFQRERDDIGQYLDVSMTDCMAHWLNPRKGVCHVNGFTALTEQRKVALTRPAYGVFDCRDGAVTIAALEGHFWTRLVSLLEIQEFAGEKYNTIGARTADCARINAAIAEKIAGLTREEALSLLTAADIPASPVLSLAEAEVSGHFQARGLGVASEVGPLTGFPIRLVGMSVSDELRLPAPDNARRAQT